MANLPKIEKCPKCGTEAILVQSCNEKGKYHVCCRKGTTMSHKSCDLYIGYEEDGKVLWFNSQKKAIDYWNGRAHEIIKK